jgi:hypothetical protein
MRAPKLAMGMHFHRPITQALPAHHLRTLLCISQRRRRIGHFLGAARRHYRIPLRFVIRSHIYEAKFHKLFLPADQRAMGPCGLASSPHIHPSRTAFTVNPWSAWSPWLARLGGVLPAPATGPTRSRQRGDPSGLEKPRPGLPCRMALQFQRRRGMDVMTRNRANQEKRQ